MRIITVFLGVAVLLAITSCGQEGFEVTPTLDLEAEKAILESSAEQLYDALAIQDVEVIDRFVSPQVTDFFCTAELRGTLGLDMWHSPYNLGVKTVVNQRDWIVAPGLAVGISNEVNMYPGMRDREFLVTTVWEKRDGQWTVVHIHTSEFGP